MYKYKLQYIDKVTQSTKALELGSAAHTWQERVLKNRILDETALVKMMDDAQVFYPELYQFVPAMVSFAQKWIPFCEENKLEYLVENKYAINRNLEKVGFFDKNVYIRGVFDLWAWNESEKILFIVDHKSNKSSMSENAVGKMPQLKLYALMLTKMFNIEPDIIQVGINLFRHNKLVKALLLPKDVLEFQESYLPHLDALEDKIDECEANGVYPQNPGFYCRWCAYRDKCELPEKLPEVPTETSIEE